MNGRLGDARSEQGVEMDEKDKQSAEAAQSLHRKNANASALWLKPTSGKRVQPMYAG